MKRFLPFLFLLLTANYSVGQTSITEMNDYEFFQYIKSLAKDDYENDVYKNVQRNFSLRAELLKRLESYLVVFTNYSVAPMYLEDESDKRAYSVYVQEFKQALSTLKNVQSARKAVQKDKFQDIRHLLLDLCDLNKSDNSNVEKYLAEFKHPFTMEYLYYDVKAAYFGTNEADLLYKLPQLIKEQNLKLLTGRMNLQNSENYVFYENYSSNPNFLKAFEMSHDNDVLICVPQMNQDRELTGGFKFTIITDYFKWRWLRLSALGISNNRKDNVLSYQSISLIGGGYTPYIRYRNNFDLADSLHKYDRPFASFQCIERAKYRTWKSGLVRHKGEFQVGAMGISQGRKIQAKLHEDVIASSQFVHGWDKQIANGGRLVLQLNHKFDFLLYSNTNRYKTIFKPKSYLVNDPKRRRGCVKKQICKNLCKHGEACRKYGGRNIIGEFDLKAGTIMTTMGVGIRFSTLDLLKQSGNQMIASRGNSKDEFGWKIDIGFNYRYVVHNSLLEGIGFLKTFKEDPYDIEPIDDYTLGKNEIERNMFILDGGLSLKWRKTTVFFRQNFHTLEYRSRLSRIDFQNTRLISEIDKRDIEYYNNTVIQEQKSFLNNKVFGKQIYGYGTLGMVWIIE